MGFVMLVALALAFQVAAAQPAPELVAGVNTDADEYGPTLTADGRTVFFTRRVNRRGEENIVMARWENGAWTVAVTAPFSGGGLDKEPYLAPDGRRLFFASRRAYPGKDSARGEEAYDLFVVERAGEGWGEARPVAGVNSAAYDNYPAVAANGNLYFSSHRASGRQNNLFTARRLGDRYEAPRLLWPDTGGMAADPFVAPDESYLIFSSDRPGGAGAGDLYVSFNRGGTWSAPVSLGPVVNTTDYEYTPWVSADGRWLWFSRGWGEIWRIETRYVAGLRGPEG